MPTPEDLADFVAERAKENPRVRKVVGDVKLFDGLLEHPGWQRLAEIVRGERDRFLTSVTSALWRGEVVDQRKLDYTRGFYEGARWIIETPVEAEASLEAAASKAWSLAQIEAARESEEDSPYLQDPTGGE